MTIGDIATLIIALATTGSLIYISRQVNVARQQAKGQFLLALDAQFEKFNSITGRLVNEQGFTPDGKDWYEIWGLMSVFERINIMTEDKILDIGLVDRLHGFRLRSLIANDTIYQRLGATGSEWQDFIDLCYAIANFREQKADPRDKTFIERVRKLNKSSAKNDPFRF
ncbi:MAG: hypothetical protein ABI970_08565 [Chloroflexota bacterium]|nr:hypothetical protein [Anaerolineae bacterium]